MQQSLLAASPVASNRAIYGAFNNSVCPFFSQGHLGAWSVIIAYIQVTGSEGRLAKLKPQFAMDIVFVRLWMNLQYFDMNKNHMHVVSKTHRECERDIAETSKQNLYS